MEKIYNPSESEKILSAALNKPGAYLSPQDNSLEAQLRRDRAVRDARREVEPLIQECRRAGKLTLMDYIPVYCAGRFGFG